MQASPADRAYGAGRRDPSSEEDSGAPRGDGARLPVHLGAVCSEDTRCAETTTRPDARHWAMIPSRCDSSITLPYRVAPGELLDPHVAERLPCLIGESSVHAELVRLRRHHVVLPSAITVVQPGPSVIARLA